MGKASSSKKVARAARAGGRSRVATQRSLLFPSVMVGVVVVGLLLVVYARGERNQNLLGDPPRAGLDHWHAAYGIYVCDRFLPTPPYAESDPDPVGIHTHGDGVIHIHPFTSAASGNRATIGKFLDTVGTTYSNTKMSWSRDVGTFENGVTKCGEGAAAKDGRLKIAVWKDAAQTGPPDIFTRNFGDIRFTNDRMAITFAFVPDGVEIPKPPTVPQLDQLTDVPGATPPTDVATTVAGGADTSAPAATDAPAATEAPAPATTTSG